MHALRPRPGAAPAFLVAAAAALLLVAAGCGPGPGPTPTPPPSFPPVPLGLDPLRPIILVDTLPNPISLPDTYDAREVVLYADGTLVVSNPAGSLLATVTATLSPEALAGAWARVHASGLARDGSLSLDGLFDAGTTRFLVDDGTTNTEFLVYALGAEPMDGQSPFPAADSALRRNAAETIDSFRELATQAPWTPPALLLWWSGYEDFPGGAVAPRVPWTPAVDLATAGAAVRHPIFQRCVRVDGAAAAEVAQFVRALRSDVVVEQGGDSYALGVRPIYPDEQDVACRP
jgi:hypothetical protein